jgi:endonuclease/exonuclease/phosphatase (EEP) superfamily protein YafD
MIARVLAAVLIVAVAVVLLVVAWPQLFRLEWTIPLAQAVSLRGVAIAGAVAGIVLLTIVAMISAGARRLTGSIVLTLVAFCAISLAVLATRGFGDESFALKAPSDLTVLSWNTLGDAPGAQAIADLALDTDADIITLPETSEATGVEIAVLMGAAGRPMWAYTTPFDQISKARSTTLLITADLGTYTVQNDVGNTAVLPTVVATPDSGVGPTIVSAHPVAPITDEMDNWRSDLTWLASICTGDNMIMAGDFNSTLDHYVRLAGDTGVFGECNDAAAQSDNGSVGTWPTNYPAIVGAPIDHVMYSSHWQVTGMRVIQTHDSMGSDHRPVVAQLSPAE